MTQATQENATKTETGKEIVPFTTALVRFDINEQVISDLEEATKLEITDRASEQVVRKHRQNAKAIEVKINKKRLKLNRDYKAMTEQAAGLIAPRVTAAYQTLDGKIKAVEQARETAKAAEAKAENERLGAIQARFDILSFAGSKPLEYNRAALDIEVDIANLEAFEINEADFHERKGEADLIKVGAIVNAKAALTGRKAFEASQAEAQHLTERLEKERARLEKAAIEAEEVIKKEKEQAAKWEKERLDALEKAAANMAAERKQLEADKAEAEKQLIISTRESVWEAAHQDNFDFDHINAIAYHEKFKAELQAEMDQARSESLAAWNNSEQAKKDAAERLKLVGPDKIVLAAIATEIDLFLEKHESPTMHTDEANILVRDLISSIKHRVFLFDNDAKELS